MDSTRWAPAFFSRYSKGKAIWDFERNPAESSLDFLVTLGRRIGSRAVLVPTTDTAAVFIADHKEVLRSLFTFAALDPLLIRSLCNKREVYELARKFGVAVPQMTVPETRAELASCFGYGKYPLIVKSIDGRFRKHKSQTKAVVRDRDEAFALYARIQDEVIGRIIVQEWIPMGAGTDWMFNGYLTSRSECLAAFTGRKLRQYPPDIGVTSLGVCERNDRLQEIAIGFLKSVHYEGAVDMDFRYDERDGQYKLLDVNPRIGGSFRLFVSEEGLDVAQVLYLDQTGRSIRAGQVVEGRKWVVEDYDLVTAIGCSVKRRMGFREWWSSLRGIQEFGFLSAADPMPSAFMLRDDVAEVVDQLDALRSPIGPFESNSGATVLEMSLSNSEGSQGEA
ncbi:MAG TPA: hypothetical protein VKT49_10185 [Bryobacteraceae bacterium]|nr:hypothetical protein [Bryobacteraceae bacterium]